MNCKKCGNVVDPNNKFCNVCGEAIEGNSNNQPINNSVVLANNAPESTNNVVEPVNNGVSNSPSISNNGGVNSGSSNNVTPNVQPSNVSPVAPNNNESNLGGVNGSVEQNPMSQQTPPINNVPVAPNNVNNQIPNNVNPAINQNAITQKQVVQQNPTKKNNTLTIIIIVLAVLVVFVAVIVAVTFVFKFAGNQSSGSSTPATSSSTTTSTTSKKTTTTAQPISAKVSHYGYDFIIPDGFKVSDKKIVEGMYTLFNSQKQTVFCYNLFNDSYSDVPSLVQMKQTKYEEEGAIVIANEDEKNGIKYYLLDVTYNNVKCLEYIIDFKGEGIFLAYAYKLENYGKDNYTDTLIEFVSNAKYSSGTFAKGSFSSENKPNIKYDVVIPE